MSSIRFFAPGTPFGPCETCDHAACRWIINTADSPCDECEQPLGYDRPFVTFLHGNQHFNCDTPRWPRPAFMVIESRDAIWERDQRGRLDRTLANLLCPDCLLPLGTGHFFDLRRVAPDDPSPQPPVLHHLKCREGSAQRRYAACFQDGPYSPYRVWQEAWFSAQDCSACGHPFYPESRIVADGMGGLIHVVCLEDEPEGGDA